MDKNRFDLEDELMKCWHITDDIDAVSSIIADVDMDVQNKDKLLNILIGMKELYDYKFQQVFNTMNDLIYQQKLQ